MSMVCDACGTKFGRLDGDGSASLNVTPPRADFRVLMAAGLTPEHRDPLDLDLCRTCARKALAHLGLPTDICDLPKLPPPPAEKTEAPRGQLSEEDLRSLGLTDADLRSLGLGPKVPTS